MLQASQIALESWCCGTEKKCYLQNFAELRDISIPECFPKIRFTTNELSTAN